MIDILEGLGVAVLGTLVLCLITISVYATIKVVTDRKNPFEQSNSAENDNLERYYREIIAQDFDRMAGERNLANPEVSSLHSRWATSAADRIRYPERYSGAAQGGGDVLHAVSADGT